MKYLVAELAGKAVKAWYEKGQVCVRLEDDREIRFPAGKNKILARASDEAVSNIEIICNGTGLHWPDLDEDITVNGILEGRFGR